MNRGEPVVTRIKGGYYSAAYEFDFVRGPKGFLGGTLGAKVIDLDMTMVAPSDGQREQDTLRTGVPALGLITRVYAGRVSLEGEISGMTLGDRGNVLEFNAAAKLHISDRLGAGGGYRYLKIKGQDERDFGELSLSGWHFGLEISL